MISICIPVYNFDVIGLVKALEEQCRQLSVPAEIILIDDASSKAIQEINKPSCSKHQYYELTENIGRARIRNLFLDYAQFEYLLFLDCDGIITTPNFLEKYLECIKNTNPEVVCGGRVYPEIPPGKNQLLRWKYGVKVESRNALERSKCPNQSFMTNNFLLRKSLLERLKFDERLQQYGHEDTLFGIELKRNQVSVTHIENPVLNGDIETNELFLEKTEKGIENLMKIVTFQNDKTDLVKNVKLLSVYYTMRKFYLVGIVRVVFLVFRKMIRKRLAHGKADLTLFDFYKLGYASALK